MELLRKRGTWLSAVMAGVIWVSGCQAPGPLVPPAGIKPPSTMSPVGNGLASATFKDISAFPLSLDPGIGRRYAGADDCNNAPSYACTFGHGLTREQMLSLPADTEVVYLVGDKTWRYTYHSQENVIKYLGTGPNTYVPGCVIRNSLEEPCFTGGPPGGGPIGGPPRPSESPASSPEPPRLKITAMNTEFSPDGDDVNDVALLRVEASESLGPWKLSIDGVSTETAGGAAVIAYMEQGDADIQWVGSVGGTILRNGTYTVRLAAQGREETAHVTINGDIYRLGGGGGDFRGDKYRGLVYDNPWKLRPGIDSIKVQRGVYPYPPGLMREINDIAKLRGMRVQSPLPRHPDDVYMMGRAWVGENPVAIIDRHRGLVVGWRSTVDPNRSFRFPERKTYQPKGPDVANFVLNGPKGTHKSGVTKDGIILNYHLDVTKSAPLYYFNVIYYPH